MKSGKKWQKKLIPFERADIKNDSLPAQNSGIAFGNSTCGI